MTPASSERLPQTLAYSWYIVFLCWLAYIFSFIDRQIIALLVGPIRADLQISDTQFSLLHGLAFAIFYAIMGIPIARMADTKSRPLIIAVGIFTWSIATVLCGLTKNFWQLFVARMGVGVGEAALSPAAYSMISDSFPKSKLGLALGVYSTGSFIGAGLAFLIGGVVIEWITGLGEISFPLIGIIKPWQMTFFIVGLPGVLISALFILTIRDPERKGIANRSSMAGFKLGEVFSYISSHKRAFITHYFGFGVLSMATMSLLSWGPAFLSRNYTLTPGELGTYLGILVLVSNTSGVLCGGLLTDYFTRKGRNDAAFLAGMVGGLGVIIPAALFSSMPGFHSALVVYGIAMFFASFPLAISGAALQLMAPNQMRAQVTALFLLFMNLFGITLGSLLVAICTDYVFKDDLAVGYSMSIIASAAALIGVLILSRGLKSYAKTVLELSA